MFIARYFFYIFLNFTIINCLYCIDSTPAQILDSAGIQAEDSDATLIGENKQLESTSGDKAVTKKQDKKNSVAKKIGIGVCGGLASGVVVGGLVWLICSQMCPKRSCENDTDYKKTTLEITPEEFIKSLEGRPNYEIFSYKIGMRWNNLNQDWIMLPTDQKVELANHIMKFGCLGVDKQYSLLHKSVDSELFSFVPHLILAGANVKRLYSKTLSTSMQPTTSTMLDDLAFKFGLTPPNESAKLLQLTLIRHLLLLVGATADPKKYYQAASHGEIALLECNCTLLRNSDIKANTCFYDHELIGKPSALACSWVYEESNGGNVLHYLIKNNSKKLLQRIDFFISAVVEYTRRCTFLPEQSRNFWIELIKAIFVNQMDLQGNRPLDLALEKIGLDLVIQKLKENGAVTKNEYPEIDRFVRAILV